MVETRRLKDLTGDTLPRLRLPDGRLTVALSGGADSAALAYLALQSGAEVEALHVHHGFAASDSLASAAVTIASDLGLRLETVSVDVDAGPSPEDNARRARYEVFDTRSSPIVTAHTRDDNAETILLNLVRGTGISGLAGIPRHRPPVTWRPMLDIARSETREIATLVGLGFMDDPMNDDTEVTRVFLRQSVMPLLRELNPRLDEALGRAAKSLRADSGLLDSMTPEATATVAASVVQTLPRPVADRLLMAMLGRAGIQSTRDRVERMWSVVSGESDAQELADGVKVARRGALVVVE